MSKSLKSCPTLRPYKLQPTRLRCPRDSPGRNIGVACHAVLQGILLNQGSNLSLLCLLHQQEGSLPLEPPGKPFWVLCFCVSHSGGSNSLQPHRLQCARLLCPWDSPDKRMACHFLLQRIFPLPGMNPGLLHCWQILYRLSYRKVLATIVNVNQLVSLSALFMVFLLSNQKERSIIHNQVN